MNIAENLKKIRTEKGFSQTEMAKKLNITRQAYNHYETGRRIPPFETLEEIADLFDTDLNFFAEETIKPGGIFTTKIDFTGEKIMAIADILTPEERLLLEKIRRLDPAKRAAIETLLD